MNLTSQGYYNLIVYESDAEDLKHLFEWTGEHEVDEIIEWVDEALTYLADRLIDESHSTDDDNLPDTSDIYEKIGALIDIRAKLSSRQTGTEAIVFPDY